VASDPVPPPDGPGPPSPPSRPPPSRPPPSRPPPSRPPPSRPPGEYRPDLRPMLILFGLLAAVIVGWILLGPLILPG